MRALITVALLSSLAQADASVPRESRPFDRFVRDLAARRGQKLVASWRVNLDREPDLELVAVLYDDDGEYGDFIIEKRGRQRWDVRFYADGRTLPNANGEIVPPPNEQPFYRGPHARRPQTILYRTGHRGGYDDVLLALRDGRVAVVYEEGPRFASCCHFSTESGSKCLTQSGSAGSRGRGRMADHSTAFPQPKCLRSDFLACRPSSRKPTFDVESLTPQSAWRPDAPAFDGWPPECLIRRRREARPMRLLPLFARVSATAMLLVNAGCFSPGTCSKNVHIVTSVGKEPLAMWVAPSQDVFVVGSAGLTERNATVLQVAGGANFQSLWGSSSSDLYAVGDGGVFHWDGGAGWTNQVPTGHDFRAVRGADAQHIWAAGAPDIRADGALLFSTGDGDWSSVAIATIPLMTNLWVQSSDDVLAVGLNGTIAHLKGGAWRVESIGIPTVGLIAAWSSSATDLYVVGNDASDGIIAHSTGDGSWTTKTVAGSFLEAVWGTSSSDVFAAGSNGSGSGCALLHFDGSSWTNQESAPCTHGIVDGVSLDQQRMIVLQADGNVSSRIGSAWTQYDATVHASAYDTTLTANRVGFDGKCPL